MSTWSKIFHNWSTWSLNTVSPIIHLIFFFSLSLISLSLSLSLSLLFVTLSSPLIPPFLTKSLSSLSSHLTHQSLPLFLPSFEQHGHYDQSKTREKKILLFTIKTPATKKSPHKTHRIHYTETHPQHNTLIDLNLKKKKKKKPNPIHQTTSPLFRWVKQPPSPHQVTQIPQLS